MKSGFVKLVGCIAMFAPFGMTGCASSQQCQVVCEDPAVPMMHPLGAVSQAHYNVMQANGEAADFVLSSGEFEPDSPELTASGRDHILEIGTRMAGTPFPVIVERSDSANAQIDALRRDMVVRILSDLGNGDATERTLISRPYSDGMSGTEAVGQHPVASYGG